MTDRSDAVRDAILDSLAELDGGRYARDVKLPDGATASERRRVTEYVGGIVRMRRWLDFLIDTWARAGSDVKPDVRRILRIGVYELIVLESPPHAVLNASVEQAKRRSKGRGVPGFVNAILRQVDRSRESMPAPDSGNAAEDLAILHSHPTWMVERWLQRYGREETVRLLEWDNRRPAFGVRVNRLRTDRDDFGRRLDSLGIAWRPSRFLDDYLLTNELQPLLTSDLAAEGLFAIQDESAGLVVSVLDPRPGEFVLDACTAPGGKLIRAAMLMENRGRILGVDPNGRRLEMAREAAAAQGVDIASFATESFLQFELPSDAKPDAILIDAPCSGLGVLARRPDLRWRKDESVILQLTGLQDRLLDRAARMLKPGGRLVYATCTIEPEENERRAEAFLGRHPDFDEQSVRLLVADDVISEEGRLATLPSRQEIDGAFAAVFRKGN